MIRANAVAGALLALSLTSLTGCGPTSIRSHLPHIVLLAKTSPVKTAAASLLLPTRVLFPQSQVVVPARADDALLLALKSSADGNMLRAGLIDEGTVAYIISTRPMTPPPRVQIGIDRYASVTDAVVCYQLLMNHGPSVRNATSQSKPGLGSQSARYQVNLSAYVGDIVYVRERNIILRVYVATPQVDKDPTLVGKIASLEADEITRSP